nr:LysR family transcriptional regulator substrate-binding protein [Leucobacter chromiireducens]
MSEPTTAQPDAPAPAPAPIQLGFARGIAPSKWAERWHTVTGSQLDLVPVDIAYGRTAASAACDVMLERALPGHRPAGSAEPDRTRHALRLYEETITLVVDADHALAKRESIALPALAQVHLLDHPEHPAEWPAAVAWEDPAWMPRDVQAALELVATGAGAILLPTLLARHLVDKKQHRMIPITGADTLPRTAVWATWELTRDAADVQQLVGVIRGRTARSSRSAAEPEQPAQAPKPAKKKPQQQPQKKKAGPKPGSRGAQLAATKKKPPRPGRKR